MNSSSKHSAKSTRQPISLALFGPPGAGKSWSAKGFSSDRALDPYVLSITDGQETDSPTEPLNTDPPLESSPLCKENLAQVAKSVRENAGVTRAEAARDLGVNYATIFNAEEKPERSLFQIRKQIIERYSDYRLSGPHFLLEPKKESGPIGKMSEVAPSLSAKIRDLQENQAMHGDVGDMSFVTWKHVEISDPQKFYVIDLDTFPVNSFDLSRLELEVQTSLMGDCARQLNSEIAAELERSREVENHEMNSAVTLLRTTKDEF